jgi:predicted HTH domain antitoxin
MSKTIQVADELAQLLGPDERLPQAIIEAVVLELFREHRISAGKASELLGLSYREFLDLLQAKGIPVVTTPPHGPTQRRLANMSPCWRRHESHRCWIAR